MLRRLRPTPAMLVALLALFVSLGGVGYAAVKIGSGQILDNSIRSADIRDGTIATKDFSAAARSTLRGSRGLPGPAGPAGAVGATGPAGTSGAANLVVRSTSGSVADGSVAALTVQCSAGEKAVGGGGGIPAPGGRTLLQSGPVDASGNVATSPATPTGWRADSLNNTGLTAQAFVYVVCASP